MATLKDVAAKAEVAVSTVSYYLNNKKQLKDSTKVRIQNAIEELNYQYNTGAAQLKRGKKKLQTIGVIALSNDNPFFIELFLAVQKHINQQKLTMLSSFLDGDNDTIESQFETMRPQIDALIILSKTSDIGIDRLQTLSGLPIVYVNFDSKLCNSHCGGTSLDIKDFDGGYLVGKYLLSKGHMNIACLTGQADTNATFGRYQGLCKALTENGNATSSVCIESDFSFEGGKEGMTRISQLETLPSALFCFNDMMALGAINRAHELGIDVPGDLSVIGYDGIFHSQLCYPKLTTVTLPLDEIAVQAVSGIQSKFSKGIDHCNISISPTLLEGQSVSDV